MKPDYKGFVLHIEEWNRHNIACSKQDMYELARQYGFKIIHLKDENSLWYWKCLICGRDFSKHPGGRENFNSKGAASRHLMTHGRNLVKHGRKITDALWWYYDTKNGRWRKKRKH